MTTPVTVWRVPLAPHTRQSATDAVTALIERGEPSYFITANLHYAMVTDQTPELEEVNRDAAFILADGAPLVWASRLTKAPLPERVAGSDLVYDLCERAAERCQSVFLFGAAPGVADEAARRLVERYPALRIAGILCPEPEDLKGERVEATIAKIRAAAPDLLFVALGQPKGELWIHRHRAALGVPVSVQIGATLDFIAGRMRRSPRIYQKIGMEWAYRMAQEPGRLLPRYARNALFLVKAMARDLVRRPGRGGETNPADPARTRPESPVGNLS